MGLVVRAHTQDYEFKFGRPHQPTHTHRKVSWCGQGNLNYDLWRPQFILPAGS